MNTLLVNLTRFGDLLQSRAAIADLARNGHRVALVCLENFASAAELLPDTAHIAPLPSAVLSAGLASEQTYPIRGDGQLPLPRKQWHKSLAALGGFRAGLEDAFPFDRICNLTPGLAARLLTRYLAGTRPCSGFFVDEHGFGVNGNSWAAFFMGSSLERGLSPFNVADLFRKTAAGDSATGPGVASLLEPGEAVLNAVRERLRKEAPDGKCSFIALQLGASDDRRRWPVEYFAALGDIIQHRTGRVPLLLGSEAERHLAASYAAKARHPHINLCGRTDLRELSAALRLSELLVGNDTGTMHLAAGLGVPVLAVFLATAQPFDTGPYREDCCCLEPDLPCHPCRFGKNCPHDLQCRYALKPEFFASLLISRLHEGRWILPEGEAVTGSAARVWITRFDAQGFMDVTSLSGHEKSSRAVRLSVLRRLIRAFLNEEDLDGEHGPAFPDSAASGPQGKKDAGLRAAALLELLRQQAALALRQGGGATLARLPATWRKAHDALRSDPELAALALLFVQTTQCGRANEPVHELTSLIRSVQRFSRLLDSYVRATAMLT
ncbi:MAG: glycosyltransferase family 9 protein [Desulfovibrio sp.]|jgi:ADP-heptose:LPS heptosyltransferase|nr:glycosyltransferase family 9 protein [Desulfovibrio sp.]